MSKNFGAINNCVGDTQPDTLASSGEQFIARKSKRIRTEQAVTFKASNDVESAANVIVSSISVNDAPIITAGSAERHFNGADFVFNRPIINERVEI